MRSVFETALRVTVTVCFFIDAFADKPSHRRSIRRKINHFVEHGGDVVELRHIGHNGTRNAIRISDPRRWVLTKDAYGNPLIPYIITGRFPAYETRIILNAMRAIERNSCIRFRRKTRQRDFIDIQNKYNEGCYTSVGRYYGRNVLMLESNNYATCIGHDIVIHELLHVVGLWHEHMRFDRDQHINVLYQNIDPTLFDQFSKLSRAETRSYGVAYDYRSVMHYAKDVFGKKPGLLTMRTRNPRFQNVIGTVRTASAGDYRKICTLYGCKKCLGKPFKPFPASTWTKG